jgi:hypothetical protein
MTRSGFLVVLSLVLVSLTLGGSAFAEKAATKKKLDATGELVVKLVGTPAPAGLDEKGTAALTAIATKLQGGDSAGALADWKTFLGAHGKKLGKDGARQAGQWLVRVALIEPNDDLADPADKVRFARDAKAAAQSGLAALATAHKTATKTGKAVSVKVVRVQPYQKFKKGTKETTLSLSASEIQAQTDKVKGDVDAMSELGEMESLKLQMAMDRRSKLMSTLSNIMKKIADTQKSIVQNLK